MLRTCTRTPLGRILGLSLLAILALDAAPAAADETYVVDQDAGSGAAGALFRVDTASGNRSLVSDFGNSAQGPVGRAPYGLALETAGTVLVIDKDAGPGVGALFRVDAATGNRSLVSNFANAGQGPLGSNPSGLALEASGTVLVIDYTGGTDILGALLRVDAAGNRTLVSDFGNAAQGPLGSAPFGLALEAAGTVLVIDDTAGTGNAGVLFRVDRVSGQRTVVSDFGNAGQGDLGVEPVGVAIVVPNCHGRLPTLVGDNGNNVLIGSPRADVILGRAGADFINGRGGNDRICGGDGKDTLLGGSGNDRVSGDRGADTIKGGTGNDRLDGGKGNDRLDGGKGTDRCKSGEVKVGCER